MAQKQEVFMDILLKEVNVHLSKQILELLNTLLIKEKYFTEGTNHVRAFTEGDESEISEKITQIEKSPLVKKVMKAVLVPV